MGLGLRQRGHDVRFVAHPGSKLGERAQAEGFEVLPAPMRGARAYPSVLKIARWLGRAPADVLHAHGPRDHLIAAMASSVAPVKALVRTKHNHARLRSGAFSRLLFRRTGAVVTVSEFVRQRLLEDGIRGDRVHPIHTSVDVERFAPRPKAPQLLDELGIAPDDLVVGTVSSLHERKGIDEVLRAVARLRRERPELPVRCLLVGKRYERWVPLAEELGIADRVVFPGFQTDVPAYLSLLDVYLLASREEALGTSILEAMAMGLPVIVSRSGGIGEAVTSETGVALEEPTPEAIAAGLSELLTDAPRRRALGEAARRRVEERFSLATLVEATERLYGELLERNGA